MKLECRRKSIFLQLIVITLSVLIMVDEIQAGNKGRDIIIYNGKVILKNGKKKGSIIISNDNEGHNQGNYKYKKKYMNYGGFW